MKNTIHLVVIMIFIAIISACSTVPDIVGHENQLDIVPAIGSISDRIELDQNWSRQTRLDFWFTSQGSRIIPYRWFTWLEQADSTEYFRSVGHMDLLRYLPFPSVPGNPSGLPIGFAVDWDAQNNEAWVGLTCAACHTNQLDYNGTKILIEGAPTLANFVLFYSRLVDALNATSKNDEKFERFARKVLADQYNDTSARALHSRLDDIAVAATERRTVNDLPAHYPPDFTSYARLDAFGNIQNAGSAFALHDLTNKNTPTAPVSYPFLWGTHQSDVVQWNASAPNTPVIGPLVRNIGEVVGVFGGLSIDQAPWWRRIAGKGKQYQYFSTVDMKALGKLESWVKTLRSPVWPEQYLPAIDADKAARGGQLYQQLCASCHQVVPRTDEGKNYKAVRTLLSDVGTDPAMALNAANHLAKTLILQGSKTRILLGDEFGETAPAIDIAVNGVVGIVLENPLVALDAGLASKDGINLKTIKSLRERVKENMQERAALQSNQVRKNSVQDITGLVYKARPLNGIWATAPYLHNGSVPDLWQLLQRPEGRVMSFWVGSREFDPVNVGYETEQGLSKFNVLDNAGEIQTGNSNRGHGYGTDLSDEQKWDLIEYMKTL